MEINANINNEKILVADDNLLNRRLAGAILENHDLGYDNAENGKIALDCYLNGEYSLILMDVQMPVMDGIECTKRIRELEKESKSTSPIPIIAVTTFTMNNDRKNCFDAGMNDILAKPYRTDDLIKIISKYIRIKIPS